MTSARSAHTPAPMPAAQRDMRLTRTGLTLAQAANMTDRDLLRFEAIGRRTLRAIRKAAQEGKL